MQTLSNNLRPEQRDRLHPDFLANEQEYLRARPKLLARYQGQWVAFDSGEVIAAGSDLMSVLDEAEGKAQHPYLARVGAEDQVVFRVRRAVFPYDHSYIRSVSCG